ncbi:peptidoglycan-recognition protein SC2 isoform X2 [Bombyx mori]|uniref:Uncharacterized protein n=1 Tax=Bombyx mori TaxID=7091 RepID=A0A8R1WMB9_BOMMO|nr:peptidoglycan-recognition protein SC2 isoform X2 [Bombyx mori]
MKSDGDENPKHETKSPPPISSDVAVVDDRIMAVATQAASSTPISQLNVTKSSRVHIGPKFISVTQTVRNTEEIKGQILGQELISSKSTRKLRCSIAVFVCWTLIVTLGLGFYISHYALSKLTRLDLDIHEPWYLRRSDWQAMSPYSVDFLDLPLSFVIVGHSATNYCTEKYECIKEMLDVQKSHLHRGWQDIGPNFLVSGNGIVFEGRGANVFGAMAIAWNRRSILIMFLGDYTKDKTTPVQFEHLNIVLDQLVKQGVLRPDYTLYGQCQVASLTISPGPNVIRELHNLKHWSSENSSLCLRG